VNVNPTPAGKDPWELAKGFRRQMQAPLIELNKDMEYSGYPAKEVSLANGRQGLMEFLAAQEFNERYWEQWPVVLRVPGASDSIATASDVVDDPEGYHISTRHAPKHGQGQQKER